MGSWSLRLDVIGQFKPTTTLIVCFKRLRRDHGVFAGQGKAGYFGTGCGHTGRGYPHLHIFFEESMRLTLLPTPCATHLRCGRCPKLTSRVHWLRDQLLIGAMPEAVISSQGAYWLFCFRNVHRCVMRCQPSEFRSPNHLQRVQWCARAPAFCRYQSSLALPRG